MGFDDSRFDAPATNSRRVGKKSPRILLPPKATSPMDSPMISQSPILGAPQLLINRGKAGQSWNAGQPNSSSSSERLPGEEKSIRDCSTCAVRAYRDELPS